MWRAAFVAALLYALVRLAAQAVYFTGAIARVELEPSAAAYLPVDMQVYLEAASHFQERSDLYQEGALPRPEFYQYPPSFASAFAPFLAFSPAQLIVVHSAIHLAAYALLFAVWYRLFGALRLDRAREMMIRALPVWVAYSPFWGDWAYLNVYVVMALLSSLLIGSVINERPEWSALWLSVILQIKPQWAFAAAVPLLLGRYRFFFKLLAWSAAAYVGVAAALMAFAGPFYVGGQYLDYYRFLANMSANFPWRGPETGLLGYNHSILQTVIYFLGLSPESMQLATAVKIALLIPLALLGLRFLRGPSGRAGCAAPQHALDLAFALYLGAFIWLDWVWELALGAVIYIYLLGTVEPAGARVGMSLLFVPYAFIDVWRLAGVALFGPGVVVGGYISVDPSAHLPFTMLVILAFYSILVGRLLLKPTPTLIESPI